MNAKIKRLTAAAISAIMIFCCFAVSVSAAATATIAFSNNKPAVNDSVTVTVTVNGSEAMYGTEFSVSYNPGTLKFESGDSAAGGAGVVKIAGTPVGDKKQSYSLKFTAIAAGSSTFKVSGAAYYENSEDSIGAAATMTVSDAAKSDNANLKSLSLSKGTLSPAFSASKTSYTVSVANDVTEIKVYATAEDSGAKVVISGESALKVGKNTRTVTVTAPSGAQKNYTITITRAEKEDDSSKPEESSEPNPCEVSLNGVNYTVLSDISGITLPKGFFAAETEYNGTNVSVAKDSDSNYTLYYLKSADGTSTEPYTFNDGENTFERLQYAVFGDKFYILSEIPTDFISPEGYYDTSVKIGDFNVKALASSNSEYTDLYYVYCFYDGGFRIYCYDVRENVLQRAPGFKSVTVSEEELPESAGFAVRFNSLSGNAKIVVIGLFLAVISAIALIVLLAVKLIKSKKIPLTDDEDNVMFRADFDETSVTDGTDEEHSDTEEKDNDPENTDTEKSSASKDGTEE